MLVINYNGNKPTTDYFKYSVQGNNNADTIRFLVSLSQGGLVFNNTYHIYAKVQSVDGGFYDKVELSDIVFDDSENLLKADFHLESKHTSHDKIEVSLCCENLESEIVWQTQIVKVAIANGIPADEQVENDYPTILAQLQKQIDELKQQSGGGSSEVEIKRVWLSYEKGLQVLRSDYLGLDDGKKNCVNDSTRIFINFETTPISSAMKEEIKNGRFVIRLDYPAKNKNDKTFVQNEPLCSSKPTRDYGVGVRNYTYSFNIEGMKSSKRQTLIDCLILINEEDIKTNRYGEEYVHKKITLFDYINNMCSLYQNDEPLQLEPLTLEDVNDDPSGVHMFNDLLNGTFTIGIPSLNEDGNLNNKKYVGITPYKLWDGKRDFDNNIHAQHPNTKKLNPAFNCYTPLHFPCNSYSVISLTSPYFNKKSKTALYRDVGGMGNYSRIYSKINQTPLNKRNRTECMVAKPRCAILSDNYATSEYAFLRTYPQSDQQIKLVCKIIKMIDDYNYGYLPIFKAHISPK